MCAGAAILTRPRTAALTLPCMNAQTNRSAISEHNFYLRASTSPYAARVVLAREFSAAWCAVAHGRAHFARFACRHERDDPRARRLPSRAASTTTRTAATRRTCPRRRRRSTRRRPARDASAHRQLFSETLVAEDIDLGSRVHTLGYKCAPLLNAMCCRAECADCCVLLRFALYPSVQQALLCLALLSGGPLFTTRRTFLSGLI